MQLESKDKQINELEKLVMMMTNSAMSTEGGIPSTNIKNQITLTLQRMDDILRENFKLKQEIACEKKRYVDLMNACLEVRHE